MSARGDATQLKNYWYIAAPAAELRSQPLARTLLGERLVLFRQRDGQPAALIDRCAHRNAPLSGGRGRVRCDAESVEVEFFEERDAQSVISRLLFPSGRQMVHSDRFLMPTTSRVDYSFGPDRHFIITSQCTPISEHETEVYTVTTFRFG